MMFSTRSEYGLRAMIALAKNYKKGSYSLAQLAEKEGISFKYLERLAAKLKKAGLVKSVKGQSGGYELVKSPKQINVLEIFSALEDTVAPYHCVDTGCSCHNRSCQTRKVWLKLDGQVKKTLRGIRLNSLLK